MSTSPVKAIRAKCLDCSAGQANEVRECNIPDCPLYPFRMGHNPNCKREFTPAREEAIRKAYLARKSLAHTVDEMDNALL